MNQYSLLRTALQPHLRSHGARISLLGFLLLELLKVKTVNLSELALAFEGKAKPESNYKRLQRFFRGFDLDYSDLAKIVVNSFNIPEPWVLSRLPHHLGTRSALLQHPDLGNCT